MRFCFEVVLRNISRAPGVPVWLLFEKHLLLFFVKFPHWYEVTQVGYVPLMHPLE